MSERWVQGAHGTVHAGRGCCGRAHWQLRAENVRPASREKERELIFHIATTLEQAHNRNTKLGGLPERHLAHQSWPPIERDLLRELGRRHHTTSHLSICLPVCPSVRPFVHSFIRLFISLFVYLFIHSFSYLHLYGTHEARRHHSIARKRNLHFQVKRYSRKR